MGGADEQGGPPGLVGRDRELNRLVQAVAATAPAGRGAIVAGPPGVGKSRLVDHAAAALEEQGWALLRVGAPPSPEPPVPFAAIARLVPALGDDPDRWAIEVHQGIDHLVDQARPARPLLVADDLHAFDAASATLVQQAVVDRRLHLLGALRTGTSAAGPVAPDAVTRLWKDDLVERVDLLPLERAGTDEMVEVLVGGSVDAATRSLLWLWSEGNPLLLTELVGETRAEGSWRHSAGLWRLDRGPAPSPLQAPTLARMLSDRLAGVSPAVTDVVDALAIATKLPVGVLALLVGPGALAGAERARLTTTEDEPDGRVVHLANPFFGELRRSVLPADRVAELRNRLLDVFEQMGPVAAHDIPLVARWYVEAGHEGPGTADLLARAAEQKWSDNDPRAAAELARRARTLDRDDRTGLVLVNALAKLGADELDQVADEMTTTALSDAVRAEAVVNRALYLFQFANRPDKAEALLTDAAAFLTDPRWREMLQRQIAGFRLQRGDLAGAQALAVPLLSSPHRSTVAEAHGLLSPVRLMQAQVGEASALAERGLAVALQNLADPLERGDSDAGAVGEHLFHQIGAWMEAGRVVEAEQAAEAAIATLDESLDPFTRAFVAFEIGRIARLRGRPETAARWFGEAAAGFEGIRRYGFAAWAAAGLASVRADLGDAVGTKEAADRCRTHTAHPIGLAAGEVDRCLVWELVTVGAGADEVGAGFEAAARRSLATGELLHAAHALHDMVRVGQAERGEARLRQIAGQSDGLLVGLFARHATATVTADAEGLRAVATEFEHYGYDLHAAEAWSQAAERSRLAGELRRAMAAHRRATRCARRCEGARTPLLSTWPDPLDLSRREREIARLTVAGLRRRDIAHQLVISPRTVDSHLQRIYRKLGVHDRESLAQALSEDTPPDTLLASG
jgi:DNA-binding CsgD family transcriptional regulator/tetratricopeptide (TPR) repeat protein